MSDSADAILLVGHGTRDQNGTDQFFKLSRVLADRVAPVAVEGCLLEFQHPTIAEAWQTLVSQGARRIRVAPLLLFAAGHAREDIPAEIAKCAAETPDVIHSQSGPLSRAESVVSLMQQRIQQAAAASGLVVHTNNGNPAIGLVTVGRGSYDPCAKADMRILGEIAASRCGFANHATGFYAMAEPKLPMILDQIASKDGIRSVIVQPHLLFQGRLYDAIARLVEEARQRHPDVRFVLADYLGPVNEIADALAARALG